MTRKYDEGDRPERRSRNEDLASVDDFVERTERNALARRIFDRVDQIDNPRVAEKVKEFLSSAFEKPGDLTLGDRLNDAYNMSYKYRQENGQDPVGRGAEYFLMSMIAAADRDPVMSFYTVVTPEVYDAAKTVAHTLRDIGLPQLEYAMRSDKSQPTSRPGDGPKMSRMGFLAGIGLDAGKPFNVSPKEKTPSIILRKP